MDLLDEDGYPTEEVLEYIKNFEITDLKGYHKFMELIKSVWSYPDYFTKEGDVYYLSTGGWSGNEDVIEYMKNNIVFWMLYWQQSNRGGHCVFAPIGKRQSGWQIHT